MSRIERSDAEMEGIRRERGLAHNTRDARTCVERPIERTETTVTEDETSRGGNRGIKTESLDELAPSALGFGRARELAARAHRPLYASWRRDLPIRRSSYPSSARSRPSPRATDREAIEESSSSRRG